MHPDWLKAFPEAKIPQSEADIKSKNRTPTVLYNGMLHPLIGLAMRGVIWYQGEDNYNRASTYADMFSALIRGWREEWQQGGISPSIIVKLHLMIMELLLSLARM